MLIVGGAIMVMAAVSISDLARRIPSVGGYYAYVSESPGPKWGLGTAWMGMICMVAAAPNAGFISTAGDSYAKPVCLYEASATPLVLSPPLIFETSHYDAVVEALKLMLEQRRA